MEQIERIEIESDSDTENIATIDKNHNIDKTVRCTMAMASTSYTTVPDTTTNSSSYRDEPVKMECKRKKNYFIQFDYPELNKFG